MNEISSFQNGTPEVQAAETMPHSIEAEQQLLGAILTNNDIYDRVASIIGPHHFYDPVHARIYDIASARIAKNNLASPVTLKAFMEEDEGLKELGGPAYLARLAGAAISAFAVRDYAQMIYDLAVRRDLIRLGRDISAKAAKVDVSNEPREQIVEAEQQLYKLAEQGQTESGFQSFLKAVTDAVNVANAAYQREGGLSGVSTGLIDMDKKLGGLHRSDLLILAGRPSMGKTSLATNIAFNVAKAYKRGILPDGSEGAIDGGVVGFYSLEMSAEQLAARILSEASEVPSEQIRRGDMTEAEFRRFVEAAKSLEACPLYIDDTPALPISQLAARARRLKRTHGLDVLMVDYLQLVRGTGKSENRVNEISEITMGLKAIAKELDIPVIALSQLSRQVESREDKRPQLSDLRESGSIEQDADVVMFVFREEYYKEREKPGDHDLEAMAKWQEEMERLHGRAEVVIGKQRHGPIGTVELSFEGRFTRFGNLVQPWQQNAGEQEF
ncbi:replicative DNA helicase [Sulfitobacter pseudonitzschiae]|uniref:Replicative DNA helicase n=1 Tax=Pseudosulfitobacter pseudonitzschiae TaxID=1402135 RepID=A0A9Q2RTQ8_9RHOB|nr:MULTISPECIES: replicative DNA helicase [Roseobacteraceae]MBM2291232.1 replicative DNA helicase [Pseudosulfitobacter pseudonitzschiae]MBM2296150.1 replicative DNA helicase [Pseudosulfitobacter pseudonitzschiae]MBM2301063.1 replicative DNA helicase [Pseudosulfitobacter pseudonitzschiae]MBM2310847.1 replicative DNA helicase [Pseudosulfitobacter pseudonitzschiae]MBM2315760.1 replicative DNA helicase [Pseudosulfitobacter pseudonitzschiae]|tara:strand:+ start:52 stop:1548 length:1497 start_codon:yes stop_codon:yes gene_type:complete